MRSRILLLEMVIAVGAFLFFLPVWPMSSGMMVADDFENLQSKTYFLWRCDSLINFYFDVFDMRPLTFAAESRSINDILSIIYPFILIFFSWIIATDLQKRFFWNDA